MYPLSRDLRRSSALLACLASLTACPNQEKMPADTGAKTVPEVQVSRGTKTRERILDLAYDSIVAKGFAATSIDAAQNGVDQVDVLFVIDNSGSMSEEQVKLSKELPRLVRVLASGDLDGVPNADGQPDFQPVASLHLGVVSSDLGVNGQGGVNGCGASSFRADATNVGTSRKG